LLIKKQITSKKIILLIVILFIPILLSFFNFEITDAKKNLIQTIMSNDLGLSDRKNLVDSGQGIFANGMEEGYIYYKKNIFKEILRALPKTLTYKFNKKIFDKLFININFENFQILLNDKKIALKDDQLQSPSFVRANLVFNGEQYRSKIKLKGDLKGHFETNNRISLRVNILDNKTILGMSKFSIQKPSERQFPYNHVYQSLIRNLGNLSPVDKYLNIYVNGKNWGIMNAEEHISSDFLEKQKKKDSLVLRFGNEEKWKINNREDMYRLSDPSIFYNIYNENTSLKNNINRVYLSYLLKNDLYNNANLYDHNSISKALISSALWGNFHPLLDNNLRYYFNPYTLKLEIITTDQGGFKKINNSEDIRFVNASFLIKNLISEDKFLEDLNKNFLEVKSEILNIQDYFNDIKNIFPIDKIINSKIIFENLEIVDNELESFFSLSHNNDQEQKNRSESIPSNKIKGFDKYIHFRHYNNGLIEIFNLVPEEIRITDIKLNDRSYLKEPFTIPSYINSKNPTKVFTKILGIHDKNITILANYKGEEKESSNDQTLLTENIFNPLVPKQNYSFLEKNNNNYIFKKGKWNIYSPIILGGNLKISEGTEINFAKNAYIAVNGSLTIIGDKDELIKLSSIKDSWKGIFVYNSKNKSILNNTLIENVRYINDGILNLTGGISFYNTLVKINNLKIINSFSEDALNIINSNFEIDNLEIFQTASDAVDFDYSNGYVRNSKFHNIGGDAIDFSGSEAMINNVFIEGIDDKGISVGENSNIKIYNSTVNNANIGIVSKDGSITLLNESSVNNSNLYSIMSYVKKNFYPKPQFRVFKSKLGPQSMILRQAGTHMTIDGEDVEPILLDVKKLYQ